MQGRKAPPPIDAWRRKNPLRAWRLEHGFTTEEASRLLGVALPTLKNWEHGKRRPGLASMLKIAKALRTNVDTLSRKWLAWEKEEPQRRE